MRSFRCPALLAGILFCTSLTPSASATTYSFSYYGIQTSVNNPAFNQTLSGSGSFSFSTSSSTIGKSDLTSFSATASFNPGHGPGYANWSFGLGDLNSFSFVLGPPQQFSLLTNSILSLGPTFYPTALDITGFGPNEVSASQGFATIISFTATPEPATYGVLAIFLSLLLIPAVRRKMLRG